MQTKEQFIGRHFGIRCIEQGRSHVGWDLGARPLDYPIVRILEEILYNRVPFFIFQKTQELVHSVTLVGLKRK